MQISAALFLIDSLLFFIYFVLLLLGLFGKLTFCVLPQAITSSGTKKGDLFLADVNTQLKNKNITTDIKVDTNSNVSTAVCSFVIFFISSNQ